MNKAYNILILTNNFNKDDYFRKFIIIFKKIYISSAILCSQGEQSGEYFSMFEFNYNLG
jgi:hypothetical protein